MLTEAETPFEEVSVEESNARLRGALAKLKAEHARPSVRPTRTGHAHTEKTRRSLSNSMFHRRRAEALLSAPSAVARLRLAANLTQRSAADRALIDERSWHRAEANLDSVSAMTQRRIANALGVTPDDLR